MKRLPHLFARALLPLALLSACAATPPAPATQVAAARFGEAVVPGQTTKVQLLATLGPTRNVVFASGYETWLYVETAGADRYTEFVVLLGPDGIVRKTRRRSP